MIFGSVAPLNPFLIVLLAQPPQMANELRDRMTVVETPAIWALSEFSARRHDRTEGDPCPLAAQSGHYLDVPLFSLLT
jgi:hypothetical protein